MKLLSLLLVVVYLGVGLAEEEKTTGKELTPTETQLTEDVFRFEVEQAQVGLDNKNDDGDNNNDNANEASQQQANKRQRRSLDRLAPQFNPGFRYGRGYYYEEPARGAAFEVFNPGFRGGYGYYKGGVTKSNVAFARFFESFRPLGAVLTDDGVFVRSYVRFSEPDRCMSDFEQLGLVQVRTITSAAYGGYAAIDSPAWADAQGFRGSQGYVVGVQRDTTYTAASAGRFGLLGNLRLGGSRGFAGEVRERAVGYVGYLRDFPYQVSVLRSGCRLAEFPGFHDCIVFTGVTYPYTRSVRKFVYVDRQYATSAFSGYQRADFPPVADLFN